MVDARTFGFRCAMCGQSFLIEDRFDQHREIEIPAFAANEALKRQIADGRWRTRQRELGRMAEDGTWIKGWQA